MTNAVIGFGNLIEVATLTGGSWSVALNNLKTKSLSQVARSTNALAASTTFVAALPATDFIGALSLEGTNASVGATQRWRTYNDAGLTDLVYDSGTIAVYPAGTINYGAMTWGVPGWWTGLPTAIELARFQRGVRHAPTVSHYAQYIKCEIVDTANPDGYFQAGRAFIGRCLSSNVNMAYGANLEIKPRTEVLRSVGGEKFFNRKRADLSVAFSLECLSEAEAMIALDLQALCDLDGEVLFIWDPTDIGFQFRKSIFGQLAQIDSIKYPNFGYRSTAFQIEGLLA